MLGLPGGQPPPAVVAEERGKAALDAREERVVVLAAPRGGPPARGARSRAGAGELQRILQLPLLARRHTPHVAPQEAAVEARGLRGERRRAGEGARGRGSRGLDD